MEIAGGAHTAGPASLRFCEALPSLARGERVYDIVREQCIEGATPAPSTRSSSSEARALIRKTDRSSETAQSMGTRVRAATGALGPSAATLSTRMGQGLPVTALRRGTDAEVGPGLHESEADLRGASAGAL